MLSARTRGFRFVQNIFATLVAIYAIKLLLGSDSHPTPVASAEQKMAVSPATKTFCQHQPPMITVPNEEIDVCELTDAFFKKNYDDTTTSITGVCTKLSGFIQNQGGKAAVLSKFDNGYYANLSQQEQNYIVLCADDNAAKKVIEKSMVDVWSTVSLYSTGYISNHCAAGLFETKNKNMTFYTLVGSPQCSSVVFSGDASTFHPSKNPTGVFVGNVIKTKYEYTGQQPSTWTYLNQSYPWLQEGN